MGLVTAKGATSDWTTGQSAWEAPVLSTAPRTVAMNQLSLVTGRSNVFEKVRNEPETTDVLVVSVATICAPCGEVSPCQMSRRDMGPIHAGAWKSALRCT